MYKLQMLADSGIKAHDPGRNSILTQVTSHIENDLFAIRQELPQKGFPKPDPNSNEWHALPCDSPLLTYILTKMGYEHPQIQKSVDRLAEHWSTPQGYFCDFFFVKGHMKKYQVGCPMAGLMALQVFALIPELHDSKAADHAFNTLEFHRSLGKSIYYFGRGKKFFTLKYPFVWYNALYIADVLSRFERFRTTDFMEELVDWIHKQQHEDGTFTPNSMWMAYKGWEFSNKKTASPWVTFLCSRILKRCC
jgi:hypothetical protein